MTFHDWIERVVNLLSDDLSLSTMPAMRGDEPRDSWSSGQSAEDYAEFLRAIARGDLPREWARNGI